MRFVLRPVSEKTSRTASTCRSMVYACLRRQTGQFATKRRTATRSSIDPAFFMKWLLFLMPPSQPNGCFPGTPANCCPTLALSKRGTRWTSTQCEDPGGLFRRVRAGAVIYIGRTHLCVARHENHGVHRERRRFLHDPNNASAVRMGLQESWR